MALKPLINEKERIIELLISAALDLHRVGHSQRAIEILKDAIQDKKDFVLAYVLLGVIYQSIEEVEQAEIFFKKALKIDSANPEALQGIGLFYVSLERFSEALPFLKKHYKRFPDDEKTLDSLLIALENIPKRKKEYLELLHSTWQRTRKPQIGIRYSYKLDTQSRRELLREIASYSKDPSTISDVAKAFQGTHDYYEAIKCFEEVLNLWPEYEGAGLNWYFLADCFIRKKNWNKALEAVEQAIEIYPELGSLWAIKTSALLGLGEYKRVLASSKNGIDLIIEDEDATVRVEFDLISLYMDRIQALIALNRVEDLIKECQTIISTTHGFKLPYSFAIIDELRKKANPDLTLKVINSISNWEDLESVEYTRYSALHQLGNVDEALSIIKPLIKNDKEKTIEDLAECALQVYEAGDDQAASSILTQLIEIDNENIQVIFNQGFLVIELGEFTSAKNIFRKIIDKEFSILFEKISKYYLAYLYNILGKYRRSLEIIFDLINSKNNNFETNIKFNFWLFKKMQPDHKRTRRFYLKFEAALFVTGAAAAMALGQYQKAEELIQKIPYGYSHVIRTALNNQDTDESTYWSVEYDDPIRPMVAGCLAAAQENRQLAIEHWEQALRDSTDEEDMQAIERWISDLKNSSQ